MTAVRRRARGLLLTETCRLDRHTLGTEGRREGRRDEPNNLGFRTRRREAKTQHAWDVHLLLHCLFEERWGWGREFSLKKQ